jgi:hypothetical protein
MYKEWAQNCLSSRWDNCFANQDAYNYKIKEIELCCRNLKYTKEGEESMKEVLITPFTNYNQTDQDNCIYYYKRVLPSMTNNPHSPKKKFVSTE